MSEYGDFTHPATPTQGRPTRLQRAIVAAVNPDGTIDAKLPRSRVMRSRVPVYGNAAPGLGDRILVADLDGDPQTPIALTFAYTTPASVS